MNKLNSQIKKFYQIPFTEKKPLFEAAFFLFTAKMLLLIFSFKFCIRFIKSKNCSNNNIDLKQLQRLKTAINRANQLAFWKNVCLVQSLAARWMLQRRKISSQLSLGVAHDKNKKVIAHAWLKVNDFEMTEKELEYKELINYD